MDILFKVLERNKLFGDITYIVTEHPVENDLVTLHFQYNTGEWDAMTLSKEDTNKRLEKGEWKRLEEE